MAVITEETGGCEASVSPDKFSHQLAAGMINDRDPSSFATTDDISPVLRSSKDGPNVPIELQMYVLGWVAPLYRYSFQTGSQYTLSVCMLVCHAWRSFIQETMHKDIYINASRYNCRKSSWDDFFKRNAAKSMRIKSLNINTDDYNKSLAPIILCNRDHLTNLESLCLGSLDLRKESSWFFRASTCLASVRYLHLWALKRCSVAELVRVINSLHSLSKLCILFDSPHQKLEEKKQPLCRPCNLPTFSLEYFKILLVPGTSTLLNWFVEASPFVKDLKEFILWLWVEDNLYSRCEGVARLLDHCGDSLEWLMVWIDIPATDEAVSLISLNKLKKLKKLSYRRYDDSSIQDWAIKQLENLPENGIEEICFHFEQELDEKKWARIDDILVGGNFKALKKVQVWPESIFQHLPKLNKREVLRVYYDYPEWY